MNRLDREKSEEGAEKPEAGDHGHGGALPGEASSAEDQALSHGDDDQKEKNNVGHPGADSQRYLTPMRCHAPEGAVPETLREIKQRQDAQSDGNAKQQKAPIHGDGAPKRKIQAYHAGVGNIA